MKKADKEKIIKECLGLGVELAKIWLTPEIKGQVENFAKSIFSGRPGLNSTIDEFGMDASLVESIRPLFQFFYHDYWRVSVEGIKNIPDRDGAIIVANHSGGIPFDGIMLNMAVFNAHPKSRNIRFLVEDFVYHFPFLGTFISRTGGVRACRENLIHLLGERQLVAVFPEGIKGIGKLYKDRYKLQRFGRGGYIRMAIEAGAKVIPTAIIGAEETYPIVAKSPVLAKILGLPYFPITPFFPLLGPLGMIPLPSKWTIRFGKQIDLGRYKKVDAENDLLVYKINRSVRKEIEKLIVITSSLSKNARHSRAQVTRR